MTETKTVQIAPMAALALREAEYQFLRNRCLLLENEALQLRQTVEEQAAEIASLKPAEKKAK